MLLQFNLSGTHTQRQTSGAHLHRLLLNPVTTVKMEVNKCDGNGPLTLRLVNCQLLTTSILQNYTNKKWTRVKVRQHQAKVSYFINDRKLFPVLHRILFSLQCPFHCFCTDQKCVSHPHKVFHNSEKKTVRDEENSNT